jgi:hypothetical protein
MKFCPSIFYIQRYVQKLILYETVISYEITKHGINNLHRLPTIIRVGNLEQSQVVTYLDWGRHVHIDGVKLCLWTVDTNRPIFHPPNEKWVLRASVEWHWQGNTKQLEEKPVPVPVCSPQIPHELTWAPVLTGQWLTAWAIAWPNLGRQGVHI